MKIQKTNRQRAFTLFEGLVVGTAALLLLAILLRFLERPKPSRGYVNCINNLKQDGIAFRIWEGDHGDQFPMAVSVTNDGALELIATDNVAGCFQVMSNELSTPRILACPEDASHHHATNFEGLGSANLSYFIGQDAVETDPGSVLMGDANLVRNGRPISGKIVDLRTNSVTWTRERHNGKGYVALGDGSVQSESRIGFTSSAGTFQATNSLAVP